MTDPIKRIDIQTAWKRASAGAAQLVCAYEDAEAWCRKNRLKHAATMQEFRAEQKTPSFSRNIIFYCG